LIVGFNENRRKHVLASARKVLDESMSSIKPRTTKTGNLPHLSFIDRKPHPLGTEFKDLACSVTGIMLFLEIQEGSEPMKQKPHSDKLSSHAACVARMVEGTEDNGSQHFSRQGQQGHKVLGYDGDSWFASVGTAEYLASEGHAWCGPIKKNHSCFPKHEVEAMMQHWPSGTQLIMECKTPNGHDLIAVCWKYSKKKIVQFCATKNAGSTEPDEPYVACYTDQYRNVRYRNVPRPAIISNYFSRSNVIDSHNHAHQFELALEQHWVTHCGWFRIMVTIMGMCVTDCWKAIK
jgi:hypothetical protein